MRAATVKPFTLRPPETRAPGHMRVNRFLVMAEIHDYTRRGWGHDYTWTPTPGTAGQHGEAVGWGRGIAVGDILVLEGPNGGGSPYRVETVHYAEDPDDMWWTTLRYDLEGLTAMTEGASPSASAGAGVRGRVPDGATG